MAEGPLEAIVYFDTECGDDITEGVMCCYALKQTDEFKKHLATLRRHLEPQDHVWQPIETGPKDSEYIRVWVPGLDHEVFAAWNPGLGLWDYSEGDDDPMYDLECLKRYKPSHWRPRAKPPLPAPANQEGRS
jgi:hypothetical protein